VSYYEIQKSVTSQMKSDGTTLVLNIKRQIIENNVSDLKELQDIFIKIKQESNENITYVSFSDKSSNVIVSDSELKAESGSKVDSVSSATSTGDVSKVVSEQKTIGHILTTSTGEKVYNISTDFSFQSEEAGALNIGISLKSMYDQIWNALIQTIAITLLVMILATIIGIVMARRIIKPITMMSNGIKIFADGDFTNEFQYKSRDEIGEMCTALDHMRQTLRTMVGNIQQNANQVSQSSLNLATAIEETSCTAEGISKASGELANGSTDLANRSQEGLER
jgi:HAMP domain-containing protein